MVDLSHLGNQYIVYLLLLSLECIVTRGCVVPGRSLKMSSLEVRNSMLYVCLFEVDSFGVLAWFGLVGSFSFVLLLVCVFVFILLSNTLSPLSL